MDKLFFLSPDKETNKNIINQLKKDQKYKNIIDTIILILNKISIQSHILPTFADSILLQFEVKNNNKYLEYEIKDSEKIKKLFDDGKSENISIEFININDISDENIIKLLK